jgi:transposase InsO family protein
VNARTARLEPGAIITFRADTWRVAGMDGVTVHLSPLTVGRSAVWLISEVVADESFSVVADPDGVAAPTPDPQLHADLYTRDTLTDDEQKTVQRRLEAVLLLRDGGLPGQADPDPELAGLSQRRRLPILAKRYGASERTIQEWSRRHRERGLVGLSPRSAGKERKGTPLSRINAKWRDAFAAVMATYPYRTNVTDEYLIEQVRAAAHNLFPDDPPAASDRTLRRYLNIAYPARKTSTKAQQSRANVPPPDQWWHPVRPSRPGQMVAVDTNKLDAFALEPISAEWQQVHLLMAVDVFSRGIVGWRFTGWEPQAEDIIMLLRNIVTPKVADPSWPAEGQWRYTGVPQQLIAGLLNTDPLHDTDLEADDQSLSPVAAAGIPAFIPDEITLDHGQDYVSQAVHDACELLGVSIGLARPYTPTDKAHVERAFRTVNTRFVQRLPGYKGPDIYGRGTKQHVEDAAFYTLDEMEQRFAAWVAIEYQNTPHSSLRHPALPGVHLSPNQMVDMAIPTAGFIPVPLDRDLLIELLPTVWRRVSNEGLRVNGLSYDFAGASVLDDYRNRPAPYGSQQAPDGNRRWRVKVDRRDLTGVWFYAYHNPQEPEAGQGSWVRVPLRDMPDAGPFQDRHLAYAKHAVVKAGGDPTDQETVVRYLRNLLNRLAYETDELTAAEKRMAAHAHARRMAEHAQRNLGAEPDEDYYNPDASDDDAEPTVWDATGTRSPRPVAPTEPVVGTGYATDDVDEWDPFDEPDVS